MDLFLPHTDAVLMRKEKSLTHCSVRDLLQRTLSSIIEVYKTSVSSMCQAPVMKVVVVVSNGKLTLCPLPETLQASICSIVAEINKSMKDIPTVANWLAEGSNHSTHETLCIGLPKDIMENGVNKLKKILFPHFQDLYELKHQQSPHQVDDELGLLLASILGQLPTFALSLVPWLVYSSKYEFLVNGEAEKQVNTFMREDHKFQEIYEFVEYFQQIKQEVQDLHENDYLLLFFVNLSGLKESLRMAAEQWAETLTEVLYKIHREENLRIQAEYKKIEERVTRKPQSTEEMLELNDYVDEIKDTVVPKLQKKVEVDCAIFICLFL
ncbi:dynein axonemal heavy chain 12-like [Tachypleus tridentatus]|uniref:dynein axonemal heavy chain 12-like n=1 Tax=Tachypleus tridentatus TaxID=6853 RepID=UPI003FCFFCFF